MPRDNRRGLFGAAWKKVVAVIGAIIAVWLISPLPEVSIVVGFFGGKALERFVPPRLAWPSIVIGIIIGWVVVKRFELLKRVGGR